MFHIYDAGSLHISSSQSRVVSERGQRPPRGKGDADPGVSKPSESSLISTKAVFLSLGVMPQPKCCGFQWFVHHHGLDRCCEAMMMATIVCECTSLNGTHIALDEFQKLFRPCTNHMRSSSHIHSKVTRLDHTRQPSNRTHLPGVSGSEEMVDGERIDIKHLSS